MKNHNVCIIGNDPSLLESSKGKLIDSFDTIVRFNRSPIKGYEENVGTKTTHRFANRIVSKNGKEDNNEDSKFIPSLRNQIIILDKDNNNTNINFYQKIFHKTCGYEFISRKTELKKLLKNKLSNIEFINRNPTGGLSVISYFINQGYDVSICGFGLENNLNRAIIPHFYEKKRVRTSHDYSYEVKIINELINKKIIKKL